MTELSFETIQRKAPKNAYKSSVKSKYIDWGVNVQELKKAIAKQIRKIHSDDAEGEGEGDGQDEEPQQQPQQHDLDKNLNREDENLGNG